MGRRGLLLAAIALMAGSGTANASYAQFWFDTRPLLAIAGLVAGAAIGTIDILYWQTRRASAWSKSALIVTATLLLVLPLALLSGFVPLTMLALLLGCAAAVLWTLQGFGALGLPAWQRAAMLGAAGLAAFGIWEASNPREADPGWFYGPLLLTWGGLTLLGGSGRPTPPGPIEAASSINRPTTPPPRWRVALSNAVQSLLEAWECMRDRSRILVFEPSALLRCLFAFLLTYGIGALLIAVSAGPPADLLLALAGAFPGAPDPPIQNSEAALAFWLSHGLWPSSLLALLALPLWLRNRSRQ